MVWIQGFRLPVPAYDWVSQVGLCVSSLQVGLCVSSLILNPET